MRGHPPPLGGRIAERADLIRDRICGKLMCMKKFGYRLIAELFVVVLVPLIFHYIENRLYAGMVAGTVFIVLGLYVIAPGLRAARDRACFSFWAGLLHLGISALPLFITRMINASSKFEEVQVLGLPGPVFHQFSTAVYTVLLVATALDLVIAYRKSRRGGENADASK